MQTQLQTESNLNPNPKFPESQKNSKFIAMIVAALILIVAGYYYANKYTEQSERAEQLLQTFAEQLDKGQYYNAYGIFRDLQNQNIGSLLEETEESMTQLLASEVEEITDDILTEEEKDFQTYLQIKDFQVFSNNLEAINVVNDQVKAVSEQYLADDIEYSQMEYYLENIKRLGFNSTFFEEITELVNRSEVSRENTKIGQSLFAERDYLGALEMFQKVTQEDKKTYDLAQIGIKQSLTQFYTKIEKMVNKGQYDLALENINKLLSLFPGDEEIIKKIAMVEQVREQEEKSLVPYEGLVEHIFFHPLIVYPELAFDGDFQEKGFNEWFVTVFEFKKIIEELYARDFILISPSELYETQIIEGKETIVPKQLKLPPGKKPLIISIDDMNYYPYMIDNGTVHKLILDEKGRVASYSKDPDGQEVISFDNAIVPILDAFVEEHPDFSFHGAKGIIALTGYEGILGYRTDDPDALEYEQEKAEVLKVIQVLKENGWSFASHSQGHINVREETYDRVVRDTERWKKEVASLVGPTEIYIYPFGASLDPEDPKFEYLRQAGFKLFCSVGPKAYLKFTDQSILMDRRHIDGISLLQQADLLRDMFDSEQIVDPVRPPLE